VIVDRNATPPALAVHGDKPAFRFVQSDWQAFLQAFLASDSSDNPTAQFDPDRDGDTVQIVPAPFAPHLLFDWLEQATRQCLQGFGLATPIQVERVGFDYQMGLPFESTDPVGNHYISRAGWMCPVHCIEPQNCPAVRGHRDWDLAEDVRRFVQGLPVLASASAATKLEAAHLANGATNDTTKATGLPLAELPTFNNKNNQKILNPADFAGIESFGCYHFVYGIGTVPVRHLFEARERIVKVALSLTPTHPSTNFAIATVSHCHGVVATLRLTRS
jgi:hypothetical protein